MKPADITLQQFGGSQAMLMIGGYHIFCSKDERTLMFKFKGSKKANYCEITINDEDTYDLVFKKIHRAPSLKQLMKGKAHKMPTVVDEIKGIYVESLQDTFEGATELFLTLNART